MTAEIGNLSLILALLLCAIQSTLPLFGAIRSDANLMRLADFCAVSGCIFVALAYASLTFAFATSDFSVQLVADNSQLAKPFIYKLTGVWANHQGSMLLWVLILVVFAACVAIVDSGMSRPFKSVVLAVQGMITVAFLAFILFTSNPFLRLDITPNDGSGMNPLLQDPGLAVHPPCLYIGYVGFSVAFSIAVATLIEGKFERNWATLMRPWVLVAWSFLTIGITLGSFWAYYVLGWGGWWFWDPVENVSLMPWLAGTALLHSTIVAEKRNVFIGWTLLLAILTFSLSLIGTFVVRSGVLTSVHSFAQDPARGVFILGILGIATGGALLLYGVRARTIESKLPFAPVSREGSLALNNVLLVAATATVFIGTFYPLFIDAIGNDKITVGRPYFNMTFVPLFLPLLVVMVAGPALNWKRDSWRDTLQRLRWAIIAAAVVLILTVLIFGIGKLLAASGLALAAWIVFGSLWILAVRINRGSVSSGYAALRTTPRSTIGLLIAHMGIGLVVAGITGVSAWQSENVTTMRIGDVADIAGYSVTLVDVREIQGPNYVAEAGYFAVSRNSAPIAEMQAERRFYTLQGRDTTQTAIRTDLLSNFYISIGEQAANGRWVVRMYHHPLVPWIWIGGFVMALGGFISLTDSRRRVRKVAAAPPIAVGVLLEEAAT